MKKIFFSLLVIVTNIFATDNVVLSFEIEKNGNLIHKGQIFDYTRNFSRASYDKQGYLEYKCNKYGNKIVRELGSKSLIYNNSYDLRCFNDTNTISKCKLIIYNAQSNNTLVKKIVANNECKLYKPKQLEKKYKFSVKQGEVEEKELDSNYKFRYKIYTAN